MAKTSVTDWSNTAANNTDINNLSLAEGVTAVREINDIVRELMKQVADFIDDPTFGGTAVFNVAHGGSSVAVSASAIDCSQGHVFTKTAAGALTWTFTNVPAGFYACILELTNGGTGTQTFPSGSKWESGGAPTLSASGKDILTAYTPDGGTTWHWAVRATAVA